MTFCLLLRHSIACRDAGGGNFLNNCLTLEIHLDFQRKAYFTVPHLLRPQMMLGYKSELMTKRRIPRPARGK